MENTDKKKIKDGLFFSLSFILILWIIKLIEITFHFDFSSYGLYPRKAEGLLGLITTPLLHSDLVHLFNNTIPLFVGLMAIFYFYRRIAIRLFIFLYLITHFLIWIFARDSYHIGASGLVYALMSFLFFVSTFSKNTNMLALSLAIIFLYGAMIWGILPVENQVSWESHLIGAVQGFVFAIIYRKEGPPPQKYDWEDEEEDPDYLTDDEINELIEEKRKEMKVRYWYKPKK